MYYPVQVAGALLSMGDAHAVQGDSELDGTGVETSITGKFKISVIKGADLTPAQKVQNFPLGETNDAFIVHGFTANDYLETYTDKPSDIYSNSAIDPAMANAYNNTRTFLMALMLETDGRFMPETQLGKQGKKGLRKNSALRDSDWENERGCQGHMSAALCLCRNGQLCDTKKFINHRKEGRKGIMRTSDNYTNIHVDVAKA